MSRALCLCGHDVDDHSDFYCDHCGCTKCRVLDDMRVSNDRARKWMMRLAAAEAEKQLQPVVIQPERRTA